MRISFVLLFLCLISCALGANVLVAMSVGMSDEYWFSPDQTPWVDNDLTGSTFTVDIDVDYDSTSVLQNPIDPAFDMIIVSAYQSYYTSTVTALEDFANSGKVVLFAQPDAIFGFDISLFGGSAYADIYSSLAVQTPDDLDPNFSSDASCDPLLNGPYGNLVGAAVDYSGMEFFGSDFDAIDLFPGDEGVKCLGLSASFMTNTVGYGTDLSFLTVRPMANGGLITYLPLSYDPFVLLGQGWYSTVYNNILSFAVTGTVGGDPHVTGFDHSELEILGQVGDIFNMVSDNDLQVNTRLVTPELTKSVFSSFVGAIGFSTAAGETLVIDAGDETTAAFIDVNGVKSESTVFKGADMRSLSIHSAEATRVPSMKNVNVSWHTVETAYVVNFERYTFEVFVISVHDGDVRFLDFTVSPRGVGHSSHGVLGRTLNKSLERDVEQFGEVQDFLVHDGIFGTDFAFNRFHV